MKAHLFRLFSIGLFLLGCGLLPFSATTPTQAPVVATLIVPASTSTITPAPLVTPQEPESTTYPPTPMFISSPLPDNLTVAYVIEDELWIWKQFTSQLLMKQQNISAPVFSDDGQWILFRQRHIQPDLNGPPIDELWVIRPDGSELQRLVGSDDLKVLNGDEVSLLINDIGWIPDRHEVLFNTDKVVDGPPGSWPNFDLYTLNLSRHVTQIAKPGQGGRFIRSPDGSHIALVSDSRIGLFNLKTNQQRTLLEFRPLEIPSELYYVPNVIWDPDGNFIMTSIPPHNVYYSSYNGEPEEVWRLFVGGQAEVIAQLRPQKEVAISPDTQHLFYINEYCDGRQRMLYAGRQRMLYVRDLTSADDYPLICGVGLPQWTPDSEHFIYKQGYWQLGNIKTTVSLPLDFLNVPTEPNVYVSPQLTWIDQKYFLLVLRGRDTCTLSVATLQGVVAEITSSPPDFCPWMIDFNLSG